MGGQSYNREGRNNLQHHAHCYGFIRRRGARPLRSALASGGSEYDTTFGQQLPSRRSTARRSGLVVVRRIYEYYKKQFVRRSLRPGSMNQNLSYLFMRMSWRTPTSSRRSRRRANCAQEASMSLSSATPMIVRLASRPSSAPVSSRRFQGRRIQIDHFIERDVLGPGSFGTSGAPRLALNVARGRRRSPS